MLMRAWAFVVFGSFALIPAGCGDRGEQAKGKPADTGKPAASAAELTIYVEGMVERQNIT